MTLARAVGNAVFLGEAQWGEESPARAEFVARHINAAVLEMRERCAKAADTFVPQQHTAAQSVTAASIAAAIRSIEP